MTSTLLLAGALSLLSPQAPPPVAIVNARVEIGNGQVLDSATIVMQDGRIAAVGPNAAIPEGATKIDGAGLTVYPGFIDGYMSSGSKLPPAAPASTPPNNTLTAPASMWEKNRKGIRSEVRVATSLDLADSVKDWNAQGYTAALIAPGGAASLRGTASVVQLRVGKPEEVLVTPDFGMEMSFRNGSGDGYPGSLLGVIALMRQTLYDGQAYGAKLAAGVTPDKDAALEGLQPVLKGAVPAVFAADQKSEIVRATQIAQEFNLKPILAGARESYREVARLKKMGIPVLLNLNIGAEPSKTVGTGPDTTPQAVLDYRYGLWADRARGSKTLADAGIPFAFASSTTGVDDTLKNVRKIVSMGLPREVALKALTSAPAQILGVGDKLGTIEVGKLGNLTIMNGDFAADATTVQLVVVGGTVVDLRKKEEKK